MIFFFKFVTGINGKQCNLQLMNSVHSVYVHDR